MAERYFFGESFGSQQVSASITLLKSARHQFYTTLPLISDKLSLKKLLLVTSQMLGLFVNTLTAHNKYSCDNRRNFLQQIQKQLSQKPKAFSQFSIAFLTSTSNFEFLEITDLSQSLSISEIIDSERGGHLNF